MMAPLPQKPVSSHAKEILAVTSSVVETGIADNARPAGRKKMQMRKFGGRKRAGLQLDPQPSEDVDDPLSWPRWKKETAYGSLLLMTATICILKTLYVTTNAVIATQYNSSYVGATAFTGVPFIIAAFSSLGSTVLSQVIGKRIILVSSGFLMLIGVVWNMHVFTAYGWFMVSRVVQAVGWGAAEALTPASIRDIFFVHERGIRISFLNVVSVLFTWGSPVLGGFISQSSESFRNQLMVINITQAFAVLFMIIFVPETSFNRPRALAEQPKAASNFGSTATSTRTATPTSPFKIYLTSLHLLKYTAPFSSQSAIQHVCALSTPSSTLAFLLTGPLVASAYGIANSLSLLFAAMPTFLFPERLGFIFLLPVIFSLVVYSFASYVSPLRYNPPYHLAQSSKADHLTATIPGLLFGVAGLLSFGIYVEEQLSPKVTNDITIFSLETTEANISLKTVSLLFGLLVAGATLMSFAVSRHLTFSLAGSLNDGEEFLQPAHRVLDNILIGIFVIGFPSWVQGMAGTVEGLKDTAAAIAVLQILLASTAGAVLFMKGDEVRAIDRRLLGTADSRGDLELHSRKSDRGFTHV